MRRKAKGLPLRPAPLKCLDDARLSDSSGSLARAPPAMRTVRAIVQAAISTQARVVYRGFKLSHKGRQQSVPGAFAMSALQASPPPFLHPLCLLPPPPGSPPASPSWGDKSSTPSRSGCGSSSPVLAGGSCPCCVIFGPLASRVRYLVL